MSLELFDPLTKPTAAQLNALDAAITALENVTDGVPRQWPAQEYGGAESSWLFRRKFRWLLYSSTGELVDPFGVEDAVTLSDAPGTYGLVDLDTVSWLAGGRFYGVTGCTYAVEVAAPPNR